MFQLSRGLAFRAPQRLRPNGNPGGLRSQNRVPAAASAHVRGASGHHPLLTFQDVSSLQFFHGGSLAQPSAEKH